MRDMNARVGQDVPTICFRRSKMNEQRQDVFRIADEIFRQRPSWVTFFREVLGVDGIVRQVYGTPGDAFPI